MSLKRSLSFRFYSSTENINLPFIRKTFNKAAINTMLDSIQFNAFYDVAYECSMYF